MKLRRFSAIVEAYGADPSGWPETERASALKLGGSSLEAARILADARALDGVLRSSAFGRMQLDPARTALVRARIRVPAIPARDNWFRRWFGFDLTPSQLWPSLAGLAVASVLGFGVGIGGLLQVGSDREPDDVTALSSLDLPAAGP